MRHERSERVGLSVQLKTTPAFLLRLRPIGLALRVRLRPIGLALRGATAASSSRQSLLGHFCPA
jgi:hypothetical protein